MRTNRFEPLPDIWPRILAVTGNIGGIGKTSYMSVLTEAMRLADLKVELFQVDEQEKLARLTGLPVTNLDLAVAGKSIVDSWAAQRAIRPLYDAIVAMPETGHSVAFEIGGNASGVTHDALRLLDIADEVAELKLNIDAHVVVVATEESVRQAPIEVARMIKTVPEANTIVVLNHRYGSVSAFLKQLPDDLAAPCARLVEELPTVTMRQVRPDVMRLWERLGVRPSQIVRWRLEGGYARVCTETGLDRFEARLFAGELVGWAELVREDLIRVYPRLEAVDA
jgi:hypothetical protein